MLTEDEAAQIVWDYCNFRTPVTPSDAILVLGNSDIRIALHAAELYHQKLAPLLIFSGGHSPFTAKIFQKSEAECFAQVARDLGVPSNAILLEEKSTNTQENLEFTAELIVQKKINLGKIILVQKPNMLRRVFATAKKLLPELELLVSSHSISLAEAPHQHVPKEKFLHELTGDLQRIKVYAEKGFIFPQEIPPRVWQAYLRLVDLGYNGNLVE